MLQVIGVRSVSELFEEIPAELLAGPLTGVPVALSEIEISRLMSDRAAIDGRPLNFIGAGTCCYASYMISFYPFVILEAIWGFVALVSLFKVLRGTSGN